MKNLKIFLILPAMILTSGCQSYQGRIDIPAGKTIAIGKIESNNPGASGVFKVLLKKKLEKKGFVFDGEPDVKINGSLSYDFLGPVVLGTIQAEPYGTIITKQGFLLSAPTDWVADEVAKKINRK